MNEKQETKQTVEWKGAYKMGENNCKPYIW